MQSTVNLNTPGLYVSPNPLTVPEGALIEASNVVIQRDNVIEPRRGFGLFGNSFGTITDRLKQLISYKLRLFRHWNSTLEFDTGTQDNSGNETFQALSPSFTEAESGLRTKSVEANGNLYLTSDSGIRKISAATATDLNSATITQAGGVKALDVTATLNLEQGNITGFLGQDSAAAYRVVWATNDLNNNEILGVPSQRAEVFLSLNDLLLLDYNNLLQAIQNVANQPSPNNSLITNSDYVSVLSLPDTATPQNLQANLVALTSKLDTNILIANDGGTAPLTISACSIINNTNTTNSNVCTITFSSGNPSNYWSVGSKIFLTGFPGGETGTIDGAPTTGVTQIQTLTGVTSTTISFLTSATGNAQIFPPSAVTTNVGGTVPATITITTHGFKNFDPIRFTNTGGALPTGLTAGTTYFVGNVTTNTFQIFTTSALSSWPTVTAIGTGSDTVTYFMPVTSTSINCGEFRSLTQPDIPDTPAPNQELLGLQTYLKTIILKLQSFPSTGTVPIISSFSQTNYVIVLTLTTSANVNISITIPQEVTENDFFQVYRSPQISAVGTTALDQLTPGDELQEVYEAYPTAEQLASRIITLTDITPDSFLGPDLYSNESSGVGIANANEQPPFALDINKFKNVTFYANTRTKYRMSLNLLGIANMVTDYGNGITPELVISNGTTSNIYSFVSGVQQVVSVTTVADSSNSLNGSYFLLNSANDADQYYVWYKTSGGTASDPAIAGRTGIEVFISTGDTNASVATKTRDVINSIIFEDFTATVASNVITITSNAEGYTTVNTTNTAGFTVASVTGGVGQKLAQVTGTFATVADVSNNLASKYFTVNTAFDQTSYYIWYKVSSFGTDPLIANKIGIQVDINTNDSANTVASKTAAQLNALSDIFVASNPSSNVLIVSPTSYGPAAIPTVGTSGFSLTSTSDGFLQVLLSNKVSPSQAVDETSRSLVQIINQNPSEILYAFYLSQSSTVPGEMTLESRDLTSAQYYLLGNNGNTGASFNPDLSPSTNTITSIAASTNIVTTSSSHGLMSGDQVVLSNTNSVPLADGLHAVTFISATQFKLNDLAIITSGTQGNLLSAAKAFAGDDEVKINRIYYSSLQQPEAVPLPNTMDVGDEDKAILRIMPIRDSLFVFKEDGLFRISGEVAPFTLQLFDSSVILAAPDSIAISKNVIYGWTTQGILTITEAGVSNPPISRPIDTLIFPLTSNNYPNFTSCTWGIGYDSDNSYTVFTVQSPTDTAATIALRYNTITQTWTTWDKTNTCGVLNIADDKLYLGAGDTNFLEQERKNFTRYDYADRAISSALAGGSYIGNTISINDVSDISPGDVLVQSQQLSIYQFNGFLKKLDLDSGLYSSLVSSIGTGSTPTITTTSNHLLTTGQFINLSGSQTSPNIDGAYQVTVTGATTFTISLLSPVITGSTSGTVKFSYYSTYAAQPGANLQTVLNTVSAQLNTEPNMLFKNNTSTIVSNSIANPTVIDLSSAHNLGQPGTKRIIEITGVTGSSPSINGTWTATIVDATHVSIPVNVTAGGTGGTLQSLDDYVTATAPKSGTIASNTAANPSVLTSANHTLISNRYLTISGTNSTPTVDGNYQISVIDGNTFSIPAGNITTSGTSGTWQTDNGSFQDTLTNFNYVMATLNIDTGTQFKNYKIISDITSQETVIDAVNQTTKQITVDLQLDFIVGPLIIYKAITSSFTYAPVTFKDTLNLKQVSEATLMFENKAFSEGTLSFQSDLVPQFFDVTCPGNGNGSFGLGTGSFGASLFGGGANSAPFRTYIPREIQRCRYIVPKFTHQTALEKYNINGLSLSGTIGQSSRAYR